MPSILSRIFRSPAKTRRARPKQAVALLVEALESRCCPTATATQNGGLLTITGDDQADNVSLSEDGHGSVRVLLGADFVGKTFQDVDRVVVDVKGGKDRVFYERRDPTQLAQRNLRLEVFLGAGDDNFHGTLVGGLTASTALQIRVEGSSGRDKISQFAAFGSDFAPLALLQLDLNGGADNDKISFLYIGQQDGEIRLRARGQAGNDRIDATVREGSGSTGQLGTVAAPALLEGNEGNDHLTFRARGPNVVASIDGGSNGTHPPMGPFGLKDVGLHTSNVRRARVEISILVT